MHIYKTHFRIQTEGITNSMQLSHSWKANNSSTSQKLPCILWNPSVHHHVHKICLEAFVVTDSNEMFSGSQLRQNVKVFQRYRDCLFPSSGCCWWLGRTKTDQSWLVLVLSGHQQHPEGGDGVSPRNVREPSSLDLAVCLRTFHWMFTRAHHANIHFNIPFHLSLGLSSGLFPSVFPTRMLYTPLLYLIWDVPHAPSASFFLIWSLSTWWRMESMTLLITQIPPVPWYLIPLRPSSAP